MKNLDIPPVPTKLLEWLEAHYPPRDFTIHHDLRYIDRYCGTREVITMLRAKHDQQSDEGKILNGFP